MTTENDITVHHLQMDNATLLEGVDIFDNPVDTEQLAAFVADSGHEMVFAMSGDKVVGMASGTVLLHQDKQPAFFINEVGVNEEFNPACLDEPILEALP